MITHNSIGYKGRLGNQMFQYATLKALSLKTGYECVLPNNTNLKLDGAFDYTNNQWLSFNLFLQECFNITSPLVEIRLKNIYQEKKFDFEPELFEISDNTSIEGYFQSYKYFEKYETEIRQEFTFKLELLEKCKKVINQYNNPISIHVRRGDYINHPNYWVVTPEYIQDALNHFNDDEYTFLVFSDDIEWCKSVFPEGVVFIEGNNQFEDLCLMSLCHHNIIANSSYSWWGAYLNKNENKRVVAPSNWFNNPTSLNDLYPPNWIKI